MSSKRKRPISFHEDSPWVKLNDEVGQNPKARQVLIDRLQKELSARVFTLFTSFSNPNGMIADVDAEMLENILSVEQDGSKLVLVLNSPGGQGMAAERIVNVCRSYSGKQFEVVIPHMAKSAATMIAFGASRIHLSRTAELGPVDPQFTYHDEKGNATWISAEEYVRSYEKLLNHAVHGGLNVRIEPYLQQLQRYDARLVEQLRSAQKLSESISIRLLRASMMPTLTDDQIKANIQVFLSQEKTSAHGRMIAYDEAQTCGLTPNEIQLNSDLWNIVWELYVRSNWMVSNRCSKLIESARSSVSA